MTLVSQAGRFWNIEDRGTARKISDASLSVLELRGLIDNVSRKEYFIGEAIRQAAEYVAFAEGVADFNGGEFYSFADGVCYAGKNREIDELPIPEGAHTIKSNGFRGFTSLTTVYLPDSLKIIESFAFSGCTALVTAELPPYLEEMGADAFAGTKISEFTLTANLRKMTGNPFPRGSVVHVPAGMPREVMYAVYSLQGVKLDMKRG